ncbi:MAG: LysM peptidoglycan-binding domain-containing protein [Candidatus Obscuribacterales bacterium]|jgi:hypothetical protein
MQELSVSGNDSKSLIHMAKESSDGPDKHTNHIDFGNCSLGEIHNLSNLTTMHFHHTNQNLPTLLLDTHNTSEHHLVTSGETLSEIASEHLGSATEQEIYSYVNQIAELNNIDQLNQIDAGDYLVFPDLKFGNASFNESSIFHPAPPKPHVAFAMLMQQAQGQFGPVTAVSANGAGNWTGTGDSPSSNSGNGSAPPTSGASGQLPNSSATEAANSGPDHEESAVGEFLSGLGNVVSEIAENCVEQVTEHPVESALSIASSLAIGAAFIAAAPEIAVALGAVSVVTTGAELVACVGAFWAAEGAVSTGYEVVSNAGDWYDASLVIANPEAHSASEVATAHGELNEVSGFIVTQAEDFLGGLNPTHIGSPHFSPSHSGSRGIETEEEKEEEQMVGKTMV